MIELRQRRAQLAVIDHQVEQLEQTIKAAMGDAETAIGPADQPCVKWSNVTSRRIDTSALRKHRPEIAGEYERETTTRRFQVL
jgi:predicted phage-related endonuclease